ncbi:MAG: DOMON-like domain-containing protein [Chromatiaceae bacterium]|nr:DOMON-like domain-containing protein [Chromatiaceae bacterium]
MTARIGARVSELSGDRFALSFVLESDLATLRIPALRTSRPADGLWRHTCFEAFLMGGSGPGYREFNFSPSGAWAMYDFCDYRVGGEAVVGPTPAFEQRRSPNRLELEVRLNRAELPQGRPLWLGLAAVIEDSGGGLSYWALHHPVGEPDFHHPEAFVQQLEPA